MKFSRSMHKYKYIKRNLYLACLKNMDNKNNIFNLSPNQFHERNKLFSPINEYNFNKELMNLGKKFITNDFMHSIKSKSIDNFKFKNLEKDKEEKKNNNNEKTCFIEKTISYKILNQVKFNIKSPSDRAKCKKFINNWFKFEEINKI